MRYYTVLISDPATGAAIKTYSSLKAGGSFNASALNIEFDIPVVGYGNPNSGAYLRIWGISLEDIGQSSDFNNKLITVYGGMSKGLPLANPAQQGVLAQGFIFQAFGNWMGTTQTLDFIIMAGTGPDFTSSNFAFNWPAGMPLAEAIKSTLATVYPYLIIDTSSISPNLVLPQAQTGQYQTLQQFAQFLKELSKFISPPTSDGSAYSGVEMVFSGLMLKVIDNSAPPGTPKLIDFKDLVGQPTWNSPLSFQFNCVLRGDLNIGDYVQMPVTQFTSIPSSLSRFRSNSVFQGIGQIIGEGACIRHVGNYRQPDGQSWITTVNCVVKL